MPDTQECGIKHLDNVIQSVSFKILKDCKVNVVRNKWMDGHFEIPETRFRYEDLDINSWVNQYDIIRLGNFDLKEGDVINMQYKWKDLKYFPINIGGFEKEGYSNDKFQITFPNDTYYKISYKKTLK